MSILKKIIPHLKVCSLIFIVIFLVFHRLTQAFFLQDEWWTFGNIFISESGGLFQYLKDNLLYAGKVHAIPIAVAIPFIEYKLFNFNFPLYAITSISMHVIASILIYFFSYLLLRQKLLALFVALLFAVNSNSYQAVTWVAAVNTQSVVMFSLICFIFFLLYIKYKSKLYLLVSFLFLLISLFSNESAFALFFILSAFWFMYIGKVTRKKAIKFFSGIFLLVLVYLLIRIPIWIMASPITVKGTEVLTQPNIPVFIFRVVVLPFRVLSQSVIPQSILLELSEVVMRLAYPQFVDINNDVNPYLRESIVFDLICFVLSILLFGLIFYFYHYFKKKGKNEMARSILLSVILIVLSALMLIFIPGRAGYVSLTESKHLYLVSEGSALLILLLIYGLSSLIFKKRNNLLLLASLLLMPIFFMHANKVNNEITKLIEVGKVRKMLVTTIQKDYPNLPVKTIIYTESDRSYYGMPVGEKILPVQVGFGWMLLVWYQSIEKFPSCLYESKIYLDILAEGYKECGGRGFGYFRDYKKLISAVKENNIPFKSIIAYSWNGDTNLFTDISFKTVSKLKKETSQ